MLKEEKHVFNSRTWQSRRRISGIQDTMFGFDAVNEFARKKTENMFLVESNFSFKAVEDPMEVIYEQMMWIGKSPEELQWQNSTYREEKMKEMMEELLTVQNYTSEQLQDFKKKFVEKYKNDFLQDISTKNGTFSLMKLKDLCVEYDLELVEDSDENRRKRYSIIPSKSDSSLEND